MTCLPLDPDLPDVRDAFVFAVRERLPLSPREATILYHLARGATSNRQIGAILGLALSTIKNNVTASYACLGVHDRPAALARVWPIYQWARRVGTSASPRVAIVAAAGQALD